MAIFTLETDYPSETGNPLEIHVRQKISLNLKTERLLTCLNAPYELIHPVYPSILTDFEDRLSVSDG